MVENFKNLIRKRVFKINNSECLSIYHFMTNKYIFQRFVFKHCGKKTYIIYIFVSLISCKCHVNNFIINTLHLKDALKEREKEQPKNYNKKEEKRRKRKKGEKEKKTKQKKKRRKRK